MTAPPPSSLLEGLRAVLDGAVPASTRRLVVALSGGGDSAALLAAALELGFRGLPLAALHVDHSLQAAAVALRAACTATCARLRVPLTVLEVRVDTAGGVSLEAAARAARYRALAERLGEHDCLLTAHHLEDQAETVLLQLLRGAGGRGVAAMPVGRPLGPGWHLRPLLGVPRQQLRDFAAARGLDFVADPMNEDPRFDRAYLRERVWPALTARWPGAATALARAATHAAAAETLLGGEAARELDRLRDGAALWVPGLRALAPERRARVVRAWLGERGLEVPSTLRLAEALRQTLDADADHLPVVAWHGHALRRYRDRLYLTARHPPVLEGALEWHLATTARLPLGPGLGELALVPALGGLDAARLPQRLRVCPRAGGERLKPAAGARTQSVKHLMQQAGVPPWLRAAVPLLYAGDCLIAAGDRWRDARWCAGARAPGLKVVWHDAPWLY